MSRAHTDQAVAAILAAARTEQDFAGWLAAVLARAAGQLGSSDALTQGRSGSWEARLVDQLVKGTVGYADEDLPGPAGHRKLTDAQVRYIREQYDYDGVTQQQLAAESGVSAGTISDIVTGQTWRWLRRPGEPDPGPPAPRANRTPPSRPRRGR